MKRLGLLLVILLFIGAQGYAQAIRLPYKDESGWMLVELKVNDKPMTFLFDTGWDGLSIRSSLLDEYNEGGHIAAVDANNVTQAVKTIHVENLKVGNYTFKNLPFTDFDAFPMMNDPIFNCYKIDGVLGNVIYRDRVLEIDPIKKEIILHDEVDTLVEKLAKEDFTRIQSYQTTAEARIVIPGVLGKGLVRPFLLDTGDNGYLTVSADRSVLAYLNGLKFNAYISVGSVGAFGMNESINYTLISKEAQLKLGNKVMDNEEITFSAVDDTYQMGVEFIKQFHLIYAPKQHLLYLKKVKDSKVTSTLEKVGYGIAYIGNKYMVAAIHEQEEHVKIGDIVLSINGISMEELCGYRKYIQGLKDKPKLEVLRQGKKLTL